MAQILIQNLLKKLYYQLKLTNFNPSKKITLYVKDI